MRHLTPCPIEQRCRRHVDAIAVLAGWYTTHSVVRRLWAIAVAETIHVVVALEPTVDGDDTQPAWLADSGHWVRELRSRMRETVHLELITEPWQIDSPFGSDATLITEISWRDPTVVAD